MENDFEQKNQKTKELSKSVIAAFAIIAVILVGIWADMNFAWTGYGYSANSLTQDQAFGRYRTIWDWLELLIIPAVLALSAVFFNRAERRNEREIAQNRIIQDRKIASERLIEDRRIATERAEAAALETYLDRMAPLVIDGKLHSSSQNHHSKTIARAWTLTVASQLNGERKGTLIRFLYEAQLIQKGNPIISLEGMDFRDSALDHAYLSAVNVSQANFSNADFSGAELPRSLFIGSKLHGTIFLDVNLQEADFGAAKLHNAILSTAKLQDANFTAAIIMQTEFNGAWLHNADFSHTQIDKSNFENCLLFGAKLERTEFTETNLRHAILANANISYTKFNATDLSKASLSGAYLHNVDFDDCNLYETDLSGADLQSARLDNANLENINLSGATYSLSTLWPWGFNPDNFGATVETTD